MTIRPGQAAVDSWTKDLHRLWTRFSSTGCGFRCPPSTHRSEALVHSCGRLLHTAVHCSATQRAKSPCRVKGVTSRGVVGLWGTGVKLGTALGRSGPGLCIGCAELFPVHREPRLSTARAHRPGGQKTDSDLRKGSYPRFPQPLLLLPTRESWESGLKWGLCTTRGPVPDSGPARLDPERQRLSAPYVRLFPGVLPMWRLSDTE